MTRLAPRLRAVLTGTVLVGILVVAGVVVHLTPGDDDWQDGFVVSGELGASVTGRTLEVTVHDVRLADELRSSEEGWVGETPGIWVVADVTAVSLLGDELLALSQLDIQGVVYDASERPDDASSAEGSLGAGIPLRGPIAFEIPADAVDAGRATLRFATNGDTRLDSVLEVPIDLGALERSDQLDLEPVVEGEG